MRQNFIGVKFFYFIKKLVVDKMSYRCLIIINVLFIMIINGFKFVEDKVNTLYMNYINMYYVK